MRVSETKQVKITLACFKSLTAADLSPKDEFYQLFNFQGPVISECTIGRSAGLRNEQPNACPAVYINVWPPTKNDILGIGEGFLKWFFAFYSGQIHLFAGRAVKRERRKGSSRRQQPAYGAAVNEVARELLRSARSPKRENSGRRYIKHDGMIASPVGSCLCC